MHENQMAQSLHRRPLAADPAGVRNLRASPGAARASPPSRPAAAERLPAGRPDRPSGSAAALDPCAAGLMGSPSWIVQAGHTLQSTMQTCCTVGQLRAGPWWVLPRHRQFVRLVPHTRGTGFSGAVPERSPRDGLGQSSLPVVGRVQIDQCGPAAGVAHAFHQLAEAGAGLGY
jgi:hypothetical protein